MICMHIWSGRRKGCAEQDVRYESSGKVASRVRPFTTLLKGHYQVANMKAGLVFLS